MEMALGTLILVTLTISCKDCPFNLCYYFRKYLPVFRCPFCTAFWFSFPIGLIVYLGYSNWLIPTAIAGYTLIGLALAGRLNLEGTDKY